MELRSRKIQVAERLTLEPPVTYENLLEELLPGIPNDITLHEIASRFSWLEISHIPAVSPSWQKAVEGHLIYEATARTHPVKSYAIILREVRARITISLFSVRDKCWFELPPIPGLAKGFPLCCRYVTLDRKLYVLGGAHSTRSRNFLSGLKTVYMLDLVGHWKWKQCASMQDPRQNFGAAVISGKIYVVGGHSSRESIGRAEVYDPKADSWSKIAPMASRFRVHHQVIVVGEEIIVHGGLTCLTERNADVEVMGPAVSIEIYEPVKDEWRLTEPLQTGAFWELNFVVKGVIHAITPFGIYVHAMHNNSWSFLQPCSFAAANGPVLPIMVIPQAVLVLEDELLVVVDWCGVDCSGQCVLQSKGFGHAHQQIQWEFLAHASRDNIFDESHKERYDLLCSVHI